MNLEEQIAQMVNPQEFTRLCNSIFTCIYDEDFQVIDGTRGDKGNDGYVRSEEKILAIYCPIKPEKKTDSDYFKKIKSDMAKASALRDSGEFPVKRWTFVTPRKLSNDLTAKMIELGRENEFDVNHVEATYLAKEISKNPHLVKDFPQLHMLDIDSKLDEILDYVKQKQPPALKVKNHPHGVVFAKSKPENSNDNKRIKELRLAEPTDQIKKELKTLYYGASDTAAQLNALIGMLDLFNAGEDESTDMIVLCESGITLARLTKSNRLEAYLTAKKAYFLSYIYCNEDLDLAFAIKVSNQTGIPYMIEDQRQTALSRLGHLQEEYETAFNMALELTKKANDIAMMGEVLTMIGSAAGQRAIAYRRILEDRYQYEKNLSKKSLLVAKNLYAQIGNEVGIAYAIHNIANQIRFFGEEVEALALARKSIEAAKKLDNKNLLRKAVQLEKTIMLNGSTS
ncbi:MAG TPA: hypothetical protein ENI11_00915 [Actinobacteria bacterium]|nr:hypothetical protein [Actinomycetota bacterium]